MIDTRKAKWNLSKEEKYAIHWFKEHDFDCVLEKQYVSKTIFTVSKDGTIDKFELSQGIAYNHLPNYMNQFFKNWNVLCELQNLRKMI